MAKECSCVECQVRRMVAQKLAKDIDAEIMKCGLSFSSDTTDSSKIAKVKMGIDAHIYIHHCDHDECPGFGGSVTSEEMDKVMMDLVDWLGERGLIFEGGYCLVDVNDEEE